MSSRGLGGGGERTEIRHLVDVERRLHEIDRASGLDRAHDDRAEHVGGAHAHAGEHVAPAAHADEVVAAVVRRPEDEVAAVQPPERLGDGGHRHLRGVRRDQHRARLTAVGGPPEEGLLTLGPVPGPLVDHERRGARRRHDRGDLRPRVARRHEPADREGRAGEAPPEVAQEGAIQGDRRRIADAGGEARLDQPRPGRLGGDETAIAHCRAASGRQREWRAIAESIPQPAPRRAAQRSAHLGGARAPPVGDRHLVVAQSVRGRP